MQYSRIGIILLLTTCMGLCSLTNAACDECQENNVACVNETSYYLCFGGTKPNTAQLFTCPDGLVCTNLPNICFQRNTLPASCGDMSSCGICNTNQVFACTSRTTFVFCFGATIPSDVKGSCPKGTKCDASSPNFCVKQLTANSIVCDSVEPVNLKDLYDSVAEEEENSNAIGL